MFNFFKKQKKDITIKQEQKKIDLSKFKTNYLTERQKALLFDFVNDVALLNIQSKVSQNNEVATSFINKQLEIIKNLKDIDNHENSWIKPPDTLFEGISDANKTTILQSLTLVQSLATSYLKNIVLDYDKLMLDVKEHKRLAAQAIWFRKNGGHIQQDKQREFIGELIRNISDQWYGIAHLVYDIQIEKERLKIG